jgi:DNA-binding NtrC family response regulator
MTHALLLVDDDENVLHGLARALHQQPYRIYTAKSAEEAMWVLKRQSIDVVVTDERMPGLLGTDLLVWVAENYPDVLGIVLTGFPSVELAVRAINEGAVYRFFVKPCREVDLAIAIRRALERIDELHRSRQLLERAPQPQGGAQGLAVQDPFVPGEPVVAPPQ